MAKGQDNLIPLNKRPKDEQRAIQKKGYEASAKARKEKASLKKTIKWLLEESDIRITKGPIYETYKEQGIDISQLTPSQLATIGLWAGAVASKHENYKVLMEGNEEIQTDKKVEMPEITFSVQDNSTLEKVMYDENEED